MDRKEFLMSCGASCLALAGITLSASSCTAGKQVQTSVKANSIQLAKAEFVKGRAGSGKFLRYITVRAPELSFPIVVYRQSANEYRALLLRCSHQQAELSVNGDVLSCNAHGSEFSNDGNVIQGPAEEKLKSFKVEQDQNNIIIQLT